MTRRPKRPHVWVVEYLKLGEWDVYECFTDLSSADASLDEIRTFHGQAARVVKYVREDDRNTRAKKGEKR